MTRSLLVLAAVGAVLYLLALSSPPTPNPVCVQAAHERALLRDVRAGDPVDLVRPAVEPEECR